MDLNALELVIIWLMGLSAGLSFGGLLFLHKLLKAGKLVWKDKNVK